MSISDSIAVGPLLLPTQALLLVVATAAALGVLGLLRDAEPSSRAGAETRLFIALVAGVLAARLGWILQHWDVYAESPWAVLAFRDGGYLPWVGVLGGMGTVAVLLLRLPAPLGEGKNANAEGVATQARAVLRRQLSIPAGVAALVLAVGQLLLSVNARVEPLPEFEVLDLAGSAVRLPGGRGRPQVINLWASWCAPCRREMPAFARVQAQRPDVDFIYLNIGERVDEIVAFTRVLGVPLAPILRDPQGRVPERLEVRGYPTTLILDVEGRLVHRRSGELSEPSLKALLPRGG